MEFRAQVGALSSAASYGSKLPSTHFTKQRRAAAGRRSHEQKDAGCFHVRAAVERWTSREGLKKATQNRDLPPVVPRNKKKPWITPPRPGGFLRKLKHGPPKLRSLRAPANGLLVRRLIPVAHEVLEAHTSLFRLVPKLMQVIRVHNCKSCSETHVGSVGHGIASCNGARSAQRRSRHLWAKASTADVIPSLETYHLYDRLKTIIHVERFGVARLPALVELCIQAGVELPEYPVLRRKRPVKAIGRQIVEEDTSLFDFDDLELFSDTDTEEGSISNKDGEESSELDSAGDLQEAHRETPAVGDEDDLGVDTDDNNQEKVLAHRETPAVGDEDDLGVDTDDNNQEKVLEPESLEQAAVVSRLLETDLDMTSLSSEEVAYVAQMTLKTWETMRNGAKKLMAAYPVRVCGYCPEVHIGPRGHKVKVCGAFKHQWRAGQHGWQKATIDDLIPPKYVWHVQDLQAPRLENELRRYYGQAPAVVELCVQAGAAVPDEFRPMMRMDVVVPDVKEIYNVV